MPTWAICGLSVLVGASISGGAAFLAGTKIDPESADPAYYTAVAALIPLLLLTLFTVFSRWSESAVGDIRGARRGEAELTARKTELAEMQAVLEEIRHEAIARGSAAQEQRDAVESLLGRVKASVAHAEEVEGELGRLTSDFRVIRVLHPVLVIAAALIATSGEGAALVTLASAQSSALGFHMTVNASVTLLLLIVVYQLFDIALLNEAHSQPTSRAGSG